MIKRKSGEQTLLASVLLSSPGPIVVGIGLFLGRSSTQLADFIRRTAELVAIIVSWLVYRATNKEDTIDSERKARLEYVSNLCVGLAMCLGSVAMLLVAFLSPSGEKGNVIPGLVIAILGVVTNTWFWFRYRRLDKDNPNAILAVQSRLYRAKSLVDTCVTISLATVAIYPGSEAAYYMDIAGTAVVAFYLAINGVITIFGTNGKKFSKTKAPAA